jgi:hypothetical protein
VYQCWWRICREINVFPSFECHMSYVLYPSVTYFLTLPRSSDVNSSMIMVGGGGSSSGSDSSSSSNSSSSTICIAAI